jgi:hypothetical protein
MSSSISNEIKTELSVLKKDMNECLTTELHYILQPEYRNKNKARKMLDTILKLVGPVEHVLEDPDSVHDTAIDDALKLQMVVLQQLEKDYPEPDNHAALQQAEQHLKAVYSMIKKIRTEITSH